MLLWVSLHTFWLTKPLACLWQINWLHLSFSWHLTPMSTLCVLCISSLEIIAKKYVYIRPQAFVFFLHQIPYFSPNYTATEQRLSRWLQCSWKVQDPLLPWWKKAGWDVRAATRMRNSWKDCKQRVMINGYVASGWEVFSGVFHGLVMGPVSLNIFINDEVGGETLTARSLKAGGC